MPIFLSPQESDTIDRVLQSYEKQQLTDTAANLVFHRAVAWLARRLFKTATYRLVFALCRELSRLDYRLAHKGLNPGEYRTSVRYVTADDAAFSPSQVEQSIVDFLKEGEAGFEKWHQGYYAGIGFAARCLRWHLGQLVQARRRDVSVTADGPSLHDTEELFAVLAAYPQHLRTASRLAQAAMLYYKAHGQPLVVPCNIEPSPTERANVQRVVE